MYVLSIVYILDKVFSWFRACRLVCVDEFTEGFDEILADPDLGDEVHNGKEQERLVRCTTVGARRIPASAFVGSEICEHLEVLLNHLSERAPQALLFLIVETRSDRENNKMIYVLHASFLGTQEASYVICQNLTPIPLYSISAWYPGS